MSIRPDFREGLPYPDAFVPRPLTIERVVLPDELTEEQYHPLKRTTDVIRRTGAKLEVLAPLFFATLLGGTIFLLEKVFLRRETEEVLLTTVAAAFLGYIWGLNVEPADNNPHDRVGES